jgi:hypothetical protein
MVENCGWQAIQAQTALGLIAISEHIEAPLL